LLHAKKLLAKQTSTLKPAYFSVDNPLSLIDFRSKGTDVNDIRIHRGSPDRFGYSWSIFSEILPEHHEQFIRWTAALPREAWEQAYFLDAGCGIGRNSYWAMQSGAAGGVAFDIDDRSLAVARKNLQMYSTIDVRHQSIYEIPEENCFDVAFSIGVLHHLADPEAALQCLVRAVKPRGHILIWVYGRENISWLTRYFDPIRKTLFSRLPLRVVYHFSLYPSFMLWLGLRIGLSHLEHYRLYRRFSFKHLRSIVFDQMIPRISNYWPRVFVETLCRNAGLEDIRIVHVNDISWSACGRKALQK
jgi:SAM-dependent methyltransferase